MSPEHEISLIINKLHKLSAVQFVCTEKTMSVCMKLVPMANTSYLCTCLHNIYKDTKTYRTLCLSVSPYSKPDTQLYEDPHVQLQDNPAYGTAGTTTANVANREEVYETYQ